MNPKKYIGLIDCNNFFVSCERLFRPDLKKRPVLVLSSNDGCVVARSQEVKDIGIPMGVPYFQIKDIVKEEDIVIFSSHFSLYRDISKRVFNVVKGQHLAVEQYSIDECFFSFESDDPISTAANLKELVEKAVGIPVSVGVATSKTLAKLASKKAKVGNGVFYADENFCSHDLLLAPLGDVWGVGRGRTKHFNDLGIKTIGDLLKLREREVDTRFGIEGVRLLNELKGKVSYPLKKHRSIQKSFMSTRSFKAGTTDEVVVRDAVLYHLNNCVNDLRASGTYTSSVRVILAPSRFGLFAGEGSSSEAILEVPTDNLLIIQDVVLSLFRNMFQTGVLYKRAGVVFSRVTQKEAVTQALFVSESELKSQKISDVLGGIQDRFGSGVLALGRVKKYEAGWMSKHESMSPSYTTKWGDLKIIKT